MGRCPRLSAPPGIHNHAPPARPRGPERFQRESPGSRGALPCLQLDGAPVRSVASRLTSRAAAALACGRGPGRPVRRPCRIVHQDAWGNGNGGLRLCRAVLWLGWVYFSAHRTTTVIAQTGKGGRFGKPCCQQSCPSQRSGFLFGRLLKAAAGGGS